MTRPLHLPPASPALTTVKYSLPELLAELQLEKRPGSITPDKLAQSDIGDLFKNQPKRRRGKPSA